MWPPFPFPSPHWGSPIGSPLGGRCLRIRADEMPGCWTTSFERRPGCRSRGLFGFILCLLTGCVCFPYIPGICPFFSRSNPLVPSENPPCLPVAQHAPGPEAFVRRKSGARRARDWPQNWDFPVMNSDVHPTCGKKSSNRKDLIMSSWWKEDWSNTNTHLIGDTLWFAWWPLKFSLGLSLVRMKLPVFSSLYTVNPGKTLGFNATAGS